MDGRGVPVPVGRWCPPARRGQCLAAGLRGEPVRPDLRVGACGSALACGQEHRGERAGERAAALERRRARLRRSWRASRGRAQVHPAGDRERASVAARPPLPDGAASGRPGHGPLPGRQLGGGPDGAGGCGPGLGGGNGRRRRDGATSAGGCGRASRWPCRGASPWAAAASCAGRTTRATGSRTTGVASPGRTGPAAFASRCTTGRCPGEASARRCRWCTRCGGPTHSSTTTSAPAANSSYNRILTGR